MLMRQLERLVWAANFAAACWIASLFLGGCAHRPELPCEPGTCDAATAWAQSRDPFGPEPISFGSIFGPQPEPGRITVEEPK